MSTRSVMAQAIAWLKRERKKEKVSSHSQLSSVVGRAVQRGMENKEIKTSTYFFHGFQFWRGNHTGTLLLPLVGLKTIVDVACTDTGNVQLRIGCQPQYDPGHLCPVSVQVGYIVLGLVFAKVFACPDPVLLGLLVSGRVWLVAAELLCPGPLEVGVATVDSRVDHRDSNRRIIFGMLQVLLCHGIQVMEGLCRDPAFGRWHTAKNTPFNVSFFVFIDGEMTLVRPRER